MRIDPHSRHDFAQDDDALSGTTTRMLLDGEFQNAGGTDRSRCVEQTGLGASGSRPGKALAQRSAPVFGVARQQSHASRIAGTDAAGSIHHKHTETTGFLCHVGPRRTWRTAATAASPTDRSLSARSRTSASPARSTATAESAASVAPNCPMRLARRWAAARNRAGSLAVSRNSASAPLASLTNEAINSPNASGPTASNNSSNADRSSSPSIESGLEVSPARTFRSMAHRARRRGSAC